MLETKEKQHCWLLAPLYLHVTGGVRIIELANTVKYYKYIPSV